MPEWLATTLHVVAGLAVYVAFLVLLGALTAVALRRSGSSLLRPFAAGDCALCGEPLRPLWVTLEVVTGRDLVTFQCNGPARHGWRETAAGVLDRVVSLDGEVLEEPERWQPSELVEPGRGAG